AGGTGRTSGHRNPDLHKPCRAGCAGQDVRSARCRGRRGSEFPRGARQGSSVRCRHRTLGQDRLMARIVSVEILMIDLPPKVVRVDAIQSFVSQETPIVCITDADGQVGTGYSYTIGTGGKAIVSLLAESLA